MPDYVGLWSILASGVRAMFDEATTPPSFKKGERFENYVRECLFIDRYYDILERTHDYKTNRDYVKSSMQPDFTFRDRIIRRPFYVEAKFRAGLYNGKIEWCSEAQLERYLECSKKMPLFVVLGIGGDPARPDSLSLIPLSKIRYTGLFPSYVEKFRIETGKPVTSNYLWHI